MVDKGVIAPVSQLTEWVSLLTYPHKPDGSLHICLYPKDLNKAIVLEHYKAPTLDEVSHHLSGAPCFNKLDAKDSFWSIQLDEKSSYLIMFNMHHGRYRFLHMSFSLKMSRMPFRCEWTRQQTVYLALLPFTMIYVYSAIPQRSMMSTFCTWWRLPKTMVLSSTVQSATSGSLWLPFMVQSSLPRACGQILPKSKTSLPLA